mgnify:CR=1 FL=1
MNNREFLAELEQYAQIHYVPIIKPETGRLISILGNILKPKRILEIGTAIGYSAIIMSSFLDEEGKIDTIERNYEMVAIAHSNIKKAGLDNVINIIAGEAADILPNINKKYDMIFLDAAKGQYLEFLPEILRLLRPEGLFVADNVLYKGLVEGNEISARKTRTIINNMRSFIEEISNNASLLTSILPIGDGVAVCYKKK